MFTQPGIPRTLQGSHTNIFCMIYNIGRLGRDLIEIFVLDWRALKLSSAYGRTLKASIRRSWYKFFGKLSLQKPPEPARCARTYLPRTLQGSHTNIVGILFLYKTSWKRFFTKISGRSVYTTRHTKNFARISYKIFLLDFLVQILWKTIFTKTSRPARSARTYLPRTFEGISYKYFYWISWYRFSGKISGRHVYTTRIRGLTFLIALNNLTTGAPKVLITPRVGLAMPILPGVCENWFRLCLIQFSDVVWVYQERRGHRGTLVPYPYPYTGAIDHRGVGEVHANMGFWFSIPRSTNHVQMPCMSLPRVTL